MDTVTESSMAIAMAVSIILIRPEASVATASGHLWPDLMDTLFRCDVVLSI